MKVAFLSILTALSLCAANQALANNNDLFVSYAGIKPKESNNLNGVNFSYTHSFNDEWGAIGSFSFARSNESQPNNVRNKIDYYSFMFGPTYKINSNFTVYAEGGVANINAKSDYDGYPSTSEKQSKSGLGLGIGIIAKISDNFSIKAGYEYSSFNFNNDDGKNRISVNGYNAGIGYGF